MWSYLLAIRVIVVRSFGGKLVPVSSKHVATRIDRTLQMEVGIPCRLLTTAWCYEFLVSIKICQCNCTQWLPILITMNDVGPDYRAAKMKLSFQDRSIQLKAMPTDYALLQRQCIYCSNTYQLLGYPCHAMQNSIQMHQLLRKQTTARP